LKACGKKLVCIPAEKNERRCCEAVEYKSLSFEKETANHNRSHYCCPDAGNVQSCHCSVKKKQRNDERRCGPARKPRHCRHHPQKRGDDSHVQASDSEEVKRACLLKWFFDVLRGLVPQAKHDAAEKILHLGRVLQPPAKVFLHPSPRLLRRAQNRISTAVSNERPVLRVANKEYSTNV